jgi:hypothetical protein
MIGPQFPDEVPAEVMRGTLRQFAALCLLIFAALFAWSSYRHHGAPSTSAWLVLVFAVVVGLPGLVHPPAIRPVFLGATALTQPIGHLISTILLGIIYYGLITPLAWVFRIGGRDPLACRGPTLASYWEPKNDPTDVLRYVRQYQRQSGFAPRRPSGVNHGTAQPGQ